MVGKNSNGWEEQPLPGGTAMVGKNSHCREEQQRPGENGNEWQTSGRTDRKEKT
ncbi:MAG: hypothetical protein HXK90_02785 [Lachnospiraceae bacterium]|nr:hypothetical protein [Lachnospiraceae bacterium]